eukprot:TRINITY_DN11788_c0_g1_i13.p1 TRINITY_DN11788_c0_g1~~TRINITY_DN11788_c0_g1_i13.p1  ORF type:complete len:421 (+),score=58.91 TRINITY_DN11788_c0_g1_i13:61-1323(+)
MALRHLIHQTRRYSGNFLLRSEGYWRLGCSQSRFIKNQTNVSNAAVNKTTNLQDQIKDKRNEIQDFIDVKKSELQDKLEDKKDDIKEYIEDAKVELREKAQEKSTEIYKKRKEAKTRVILNLAERSLDYLKKYKTVLGDAFPDKFVQTYRIFSTGTRQLAQDVQTYARVKDTLVNSIDKQKSHAKLSTAEYEVFLRLPKDAIRVTPVLLISAFPFAQNVVFPLALLYPKLFLSSQFLTSQQKKDVLLSIARHQQEIFPLWKEELIRCTDMTYEKDPELMHLRTILKSGQQLSAQEILDLRPLFELNGPLDIRHLTRRHDKLLASFHRVWYIMFPYTYLEWYANMLWRMDQALDREKLRFSPEVIRSLSVQRGLNPELFSEDEQLQYLRHWLNISTQLKYKDISLLLHLPLFLKRKPVYQQ